MIWINHDFYTNFAYANAAGDSDSAVSMYKSELSDLIVYSYKEIYDLLKNIGISSNQNETDEALLNTVYQTSKTNSKFVRGIAYLIGQANSINKEENAKNQVEMLNNIAQGINAATKELASNKQDEQIFLKETLNQIATKAALIGDRKRVVYENKNHFARFIGVSVVAVALFGLWKWYQSLPNKAIPKMELGGGVQPTASGAPSATIPPIDPKYYVSPQVLKPELNPTMQPQVAAAQPAVAPVASLNNQSAPTPAVEAPKV